MTCSYARIVTLGPVGQNQAGWALTFFRRMCFSELCHAGTRCSMCLHSVALPSSLHFWHASSTQNVLKMGSCAPAVSQALRWAAGIARVQFLACVRESFILMSRE